MLDSVFTTTFTQRHHFPEPPPRRVRAQLIAAGYRFDGHAWTRTVSTASALTPAEAMRFIAQDCEDYADSGLAPISAV